MKLQVKNYATENTEFTEEKQRQVIQKQFSCGISSYGAIRTFLSVCSVISVANRVL
jgi:hypothetical protein